MISDMEQVYTEGEEKHKIKMAWRTIAAFQAIWLVILK